MKKNLNNEELEELLNEIPSAKNSEELSEAAKANEPEPSEEADTEREADAEMQEAQKTVDANEARQSQKSKGAIVLDWIFSNRGIKIWMPILIMIHIIGVVAYYVLFPSRGYFHSDSTDTIMWAQASYESGKLFDTNFIYACLLPFGGYLLMLPFMGAFGLSMTTHVLGMLLFLILFAVGLIFMTRQMNWDLPWTAVMFGGVLLTVSISEKLREIFWGHIIYYSLGVFFIFIGLGIYFKILSLHEKHELKSQGIKLWYWITLLFVWVFLCSMNQIMSLTIFVIPVLAAVVLERLLDFEVPVFGKKNRFYVILLLGMAAAAVGGFLLAGYLSEGIYASYEEGYSTFSSQDSWLDNIMKFPVHWITLLGVNTEPGDKIMSAGGIVNLILAVAAIVLFVIPIIGLCLYPKIKDRFTRLILLVHSMVFLLIMMGYTFGYLSVANWRLSPIVCTAVMSSVAVCKWIFENTSVQRIGIILLIPQFCVCLLADSTISSMPASYGQDTGLYALADFLEDNDLSYGYATFWNANAITVISDNEVKVRSVNIDGNGITRYVYQASYEWYEDIPGQEKYFLLMSQEEFKLLFEKGLDLFNRQYDMLYYDDYIITVFDENVF